MRETEIEGVCVEGFDGARHAWELRAFPWLGTIWMVVSAEHEGCDARMTVRMDAAKLRLVADELGRLADDMERHGSERRVSDGAQEDDVRRG